MKFEDIRELFSGFSYIEVDIGTGLNFDQLQKNILENLRMEAEEKYDEHHELVLRNMNKR